MTGRYAFRTGLYNTRFGGDSLAFGEVTVAELLKKAGYRTGLFGKWHLGRYHGYQPNQRGFDEFLGHYHGHIERYEYADQLVHPGRSDRHPVLVILDLARNADLHCRHAPLT
jgi:arylsulfatase A-like enzyme